MMPVTPFRPFRLVCLMLAVLAMNPVRAAVFPVLLIEEIEVTDLAAYAQATGQINTAMRTQHEVPLFLRAYTTPVSAGEGAHTFALSPALDFATLLRNGETFATDPELAPLRQTLQNLARVTSLTYVQAVRFDGTNSPGSLFNTWVEATDEKALLAQVAVGAALFSGEKGPKPRINVFRVLAGSGEITHLVSFNLALPAEVGAVLDILATAGWSLEFDPNNVRCCVRRSSAVFREL